MQDPTPNGFPHERLDAYRIAQELAIDCVHVTRFIPRGFAEIRKQAQRSALAIVRHIAEGAARTSPADRRARFTIARGEVAELDATLATAIGLGLIDVEAEDLRVLTARVGAMLTGLIQRETARRTIAY